MAPSRVAAWRIWLGGAVIALAGLAAYHDSFSGPFIFDDIPAIVNNPTIEHWRSALTPPSRATVGGRPLLNLSFAANYAIGGRKVWSYHALNLLIHLLAGLTLFGILRRTFLAYESRANESLAASATGRGRGKREEGGARLSFAGLSSGDSTIVAFVIALLWTVHPLQTESVTYVVQRAESLMGLFYLLTFYCFVRGVDADGAGPPFALRATAGEKAARRRSLGWFGLSWLACLFGMATKEVMVSAPVLVLLYDRTFVGGSFRAALGRRRGYYVALAGTWLPLAWLAISNGNRGGTSGFNVGVPWWEYAKTQFPAVVHYLKLSVWPHPLVLDYGTQWVANAGKIIPDALLVIALMGATAYALLRSPLKSGNDRAKALGFAGAWFFAILAPTSLVPGTRQTMAEHRMYLALAPVLAVIVTGVSCGLVRILGRRARLRSPEAGGEAANNLTAGQTPARILLFLGLLVAAGFGVATARRNEIYRTEPGVWSDTTVKVPGNFYAWNNLGDYYLRAGRTAEGIACYEKALQLHSDFAEAQNNLGIGLRRTGHTEEAIPHFETALRLRPDFVAVQTNLGDALVSLGRVPEAIAHLEKAWQIEPQSLEAYNLADALALAGRLPEAITFYRQAVRLNGDFTEARVHFGVALTRAGQLPEAAVQFSAALAQDPGQIEARYNRAMILLESGKARESVPEFEAVLRLKPDFAEAQGNLGNALRALGKTAEAIPHLQEAVRLDPSGPQAHYNLGVAFSRAGRLADAIGEYEEALRLKPDFLDALDNLGVALAKSGRIPEAISHFEKALQLKPDFAPAHRNLGMALRSIGRTEDARAHLEEADRLESGVAPVLH